MEIVMRRARQADAASINALSNQVARADGLYLEIDEKPVEYRQQWLSLHNKRYPAFVGLSQGEVVCWAALSAWGGGYPFDGVVTLEIGISRTLENPEFTDLLLHFLSKQATSLGYYKLLAILEADDSFTLHVYRHAGFRDVGVLRSHGYRRGKLVDMVLLERLFPPDMDALEEHYTHTYPFYAEFFRRKKEHEDAVLRRNLAANYHDDFEEVEPSRQEVLPEGIVRFLRSKKKPDGTLLTAEELSEEFFPQEPPQEEPPPQKEPPSQKEPPQEEKPQEEPASADDEAPLEGQLSLEDVLNPTTT